MNKIISYIHKTVSWLNFVMFIPSFAMIFLVSKEIVIKYHIIDISLAFLFLGLIGIIYLSKLYLKISNVQDDQHIKILEILERAETLSEMRAAPYDLKELKKEILEELY